MSLGLFATAVPLAVCAACALWPLRRRGALGTATHIVGMIHNEVPAIAAAWGLVATVLAWAEGDLDSPLGLAALGLMALVEAGLLVAAWRAVRSRHVPEQALRRALGPDWRAGDTPHPTRSALVGGLLAPVPRRRRDVERVADIAYGPAGRRHRLDVYRHRSRPTGCPVLVHLHGGHFVSGAKNRESLPLLHRLAARGWVCVSANYRRGRGVGFPDAVVDVKRVLAWVRAHGTGYGADPAVVVIAGNSAGAHLAAFAALTPNEPAYQPGFEDADTSVAAAVCLYGFYGPTQDDDPRSSPAAHVHAEAPPFYLLHGDRDSVVPVAWAREFVSRLRETSERPVVYAELPGAQHSFDYLRSVRSRVVVDSIEAFAAWVSGSVRAAPPVGNGRPSTGGR